MVWVGRQGSGDNIAVTPDMILIYRNTCLIIVAADKCGCNKYQHPVVPVFDRTKPVCWRFSVCQGIGVKCKNENKNSRDPFKGACGGMFPGFSSSGVFHLFTRRIVLVYFTIFLHLVISSVSHCGVTGRHSLEN